MKVGKSDSTLSPTKSHLLSWRPKGYWELWRMMAEQAKHNAYELFISKFGKVPFALCQPAHSSR